MRLLGRIALTGLCCAAVALGVIAWVTGPERASGRRGARPRPKQDHGATLEVSRAPGAPDRPAELRVIPEEFEDGGNGIASRFTGTIRDPLSLAEIRDAVRGRGRRGLAELRRELDGLTLDAPPTPAQLNKAIGLRRSIGFLYLYEGQFREAADWVGGALELARAPGVPDRVRADLTAVLGIIALRRGEVDNCIACLGPSSCIFPIAPEARHTNPDGSREAVRRFSDYLEQWPGDLRVLWLLNVASMTLGEYPEKVPPSWRIPLGPFRSSLDMGRFVNVAPLVGLAVRGPNLAGGSVFDDFTGDGLPDLFSTSLDADLGASLYVNRGDGTFEDRSRAAGLEDQVYALNVVRGDYDNDGDLDLLLLRGAWESPLRLSLLRNAGDGTFDDVTASAGLGEPIATESAAWGDYDGDGDLDLFVCGEYLPPAGDVSAARPDPRNRCRLYRNRGDSTFEDVAESAGVLNERCAKGSAWGDYDGDGDLDLFVSNMRQPCRLYRNEGGGTFRDVAPDLGVTGPSHSFACWFWDYDNDGRLDLYVNDYRARLAEVLAGSLGVKLAGASRPALYRNLGPDGFRDVTAEVGLDRPMAPMGCNFADLDNDGYLDLYLGTGTMSYSGLEPNLMFKNVGGERFEDVTMASGTGHLQKGHGVSCADYDRDGDLDLFAVQGGATPGDRSFNLLFRNPGNDRHWLAVKLVGTTTNRAALGARIRAVVAGPGGERRSIYRTVGNNSSFGGNCLVEHLGLGEARDVVELEVAWPTSATTQTFRDLKADQAIEITEGAGEPKVLDRGPKTALLPAASPTIRGSL